MTYFQRRAWIDAALHVGGGAAIFAALIWWMPPVWVWGLIFFVVMIGGSVISVAIQSRAARVLRETRGRVCRGCNYAYGEIDDDKCPECGRLREKDESTPLM